MMAVVGSLKFWETGESCCHSLLDLLTDLVESGGHKIPLVFHSHLVSLEDLTDKQR